MRRSYLILTLLLALAATGCQSLEQTARDGIAAFYGFLVQAQDHHEVECKATPTKTLCVSINKAGDVLNVARGTFKVYCSGTPKPAEQPFLAGGPCAADKSVEPRLRAAMSEMQKLLPVIKDLAK